MLLPMLRQRCRLSYTNFHGVEREFFKYVSCRLGSLFIAEKQLQPKVTEFVNDSSFQIEFCVEVFCRFCGNADEKGENAGATVCDSKL